MSIRAYFFSLYSGTLFALAVWLSILFYSDPQTSDFVTIVAFFVSFFLWMAGFFSFTLFQARIYFSNHEVIFAHLPTSIRQATFIAATITILAVLKTIQTLEWWTATLVVVIFILFELFFRLRPPITSES